MKILSGAKAHLWQRISAFYLLFYFPFAVGYLWQGQFNDYAQFQSALLSPLFALPSLLAFALLMSHIWVGIRDVMMDYLPRKWVIPSLVIFGTLWLAAVLDMAFLVISLLRAHA